MPHVELPPLPGIVGLLAGYPRTGEQLSGLADALLRGPSSLTPAERETIGAYVSARNNCEFCASTHSAVAHRLRTGSSGVDTDADGPTGLPEHSGAKMDALLALADKVRVDGRSVTEADIRRARDAGADDQAIHDTVLTAAMFSMFNRYVDGLATLTPTDPAHYARHAEMLAGHGYRQPPAP
jgi:uncharacterized peroxidase-related enzyme